MKPYFSILILIFTLIFVGCADTHISPYDQRVKRALIKKYERKQKQRSRAIASVVFDTPDNIDFELFAAEQIGVGYSIRSLDPLDIVFHNPTRAQVDALARVFQSDDIPEYELGKIYHLNDFLPALLKGLINFEPPFTSYTPAWIKKSNQHPVTRMVVNNVQVDEVYIDQNHFGATNEVLRYLLGGTKTNFDFSFFSSSQKQAENAWKSRYKEVDIDDLNFGDVLVVTQGERGHIAHTAVYLDRNLYFEKSGNGNEKYRVVTGFEVKSRYKSQDIMTRYSHIRFNQRPPKATTFNLVNDKERIPANIQNAVPSGDNHKYIFTLNQDNPTFGRPIPSLFELKTGRLGKTSSGRWTILIKN